MGIWTKNGKRHIRYFSNKVFFNNRRMKVVIGTFPVYDEKGNLIRTVSLNIDTSGLRQKISQKNDHIQTLETQLSDFEKSRRADIEEANAKLPTPLTQREIQVLRCIAKGLTNREISSQLNISPHTVKSHVIHIFNKIGVNDRAQASAWGAMHGVVDPL